VIEIHHLDQREKVERKNHYILLHNQEKIIVCFDCVCVVCVKQQINWYNATLLVPVIEGSIMLNITEITMSV